MDAEDFEKMSGGQAAARMASYYAETLKSVADGKSWSDAFVL